MNKIESPCILVCVIELNSGYCYGCGRTRDEIADWSHYTNQQRASLMPDLSERVSKLERKPRRKTRRRRMAEVRTQTNRDI
jgi:predicted Fe-S protein YdhL (DUF1289 family)